MEDRVLLGKRIRELRKARGLSQEALAERMDGNPKYLGSVERGEQNPTLDFLTKLAAALKTDLPSLFNYRWQALSEAEIKRRLHALVDRADLDQLRELIAVLKSREV